MKAESRLDEHGTNSIGMEIEGKELCGHWGLLASMSFSRYMGGRFLHAVDRMSRVGSSAIRELYAPAFSKFSNS